MGDRNGPEHARASEPEYFYYVAKRYISAIPVARTIAVKLFMNTCIRNKSRLNSYKYYCKLNIELMI